MVRGAGFALRSVAAHLVRDAMIDLKIPGMQRGAADSAPFTVSDGQRLLESLREAPPPFEAGIGWALPEGDAISSYLPSILARDSKSL